MEDRNSLTTFSEVLFLIFLVLKLTNLIDWSWWYVTLPIWWPFGLGAILLFGVLGISIIGGICFSIYFVMNWIYEKICE